MGRILSATTSVVALLMICGCGGSGGVVRASPPTSAQARELLDDALHVKAHCSATAQLRFHCGLPDLEGEVDIELARAGRGFAIRGCSRPKGVCVLRNPRSAHRTVERESPSEAYAASVLNGPFGDLGHVTCARLAHRHFDCDGIFDEEGIRDAVNVVLEIVKPRFHFISECRVTKVWAGAVPFACQRLDWNVNFPEGEMLELSRGPQVAEVPAGG